jgi:hypothetical protein
VKKNKIKLFIKISLAGLIIYIVLFILNLKVRTNSYYDIGKYSFTWFWLFQTNGTLRGFPVVNPVDDVKYDYRGYESNNLDIVEYQIEYVSNANYKHILNTSIEYLERKGYSLEQTNGVDCTWEVPSHVNKTTLYYKDSMENREGCLTFLITQGANNLIYIKLFLMN